MSEHDLCDSGGSTGEFTVFLYLAEVIHNDKQNPCLVLWSSYHTNGWRFRLGRM
nr:hypothetical protein [Niallia taxi]